jgi:3-oxoacyl-[acyl-carrier protein] reductase
MPKLSGKVAIITGGSRGIGRAVAEMLAAKGANVVINYASNRKAADETLSAITAAGGSAVIVQADIGEPTEVAEMFNVATRSFGGVDLVVNAAGISVFKPTAMVTDDEFAKLMRTNIFGTFHVLRQAAVHVRNNGRIVDFSSGGTQQAMPGNGIYAASKAAGERMVASTCQRSRRTRYHRELDCARSHRNRRPRARPVYGRSACCDDTTWTTRPTVRRCRSGRLPGFDRSSVDYRPTD